MRPHQTRSPPLLGSDVEWKSDSMTLVGETAFSNSTGGPYIKRKCLTSNKKYKRISPAIANFSSCLQAKELMLPSRDPSISISGLLMSPPLRSFQRRSNNEAILELLRIAPSTIYPYGT